VGQDLSRATKEEAVAFSSHRQRSATARSTCSPSSSRDDPFGSIFANCDRWAAAFVGGLLLASGLVRRSPWRIILGGGLLARGVAARRPLERLPRPNAARRPSEPVTIAAAGKGCRVEQCITIACSPREAYSFWRDFENLPRVMDHLRSVQTISQNRTHWVAQGPPGTDFQWEAEIMADRPDESIAWHSLPGSEVNAAGSVDFRPARDGQGTDVRLMLSYESATGTIGTAVARLLGDVPQRQVEHDLIRLKEILETAGAAEPEQQFSLRKAK
jgi:uncharacterized membrane protein